MGKKRNLWMIATWVLIGVLVLGSITGFIVFGNDKSDRVPPQVKFITSNPTCEESNYGQMISEGNFNPLDKCIVEKVESNGNKWCSCSEF